MPIVFKYRYPSPGSPKIQYERAISSSSNISKNYYFNRDHRRSYPKTVMFTSAENAQEYSVDNLPPTPHGKRYVYKDGEPIPFKVFQTTYINKT
jgi:hypothetical protein